MIVSLSSADLIAPRSVHRATFIDSRAKRLQVSAILIVDKQKKAENVEKTRVGLLGSRVHASRVTARKILEMHLITKATPPSLGFCQ